MGLMEIIDWLNQPVCLADMTRYNRERNDYVRQHGTIDGFDTHYGQLVLGETLSGTEFSAEPAGDA